MVSEELAFGAGTGKWAETPGWDDSCVGSLSVGMSNGVGETVCLSTPGHGPVLTASQPC